MKILQYTGANNITTGGGGERVFSDMANALTARGHEVYAVCNTFHTGHPFYPLDDRVHFINFDGSGRRKIQPLSLLKGIWHLIPSACQNMLERYVEDPLRASRGEPLVQLIREVQPDIVIPYFIIDYFSMLRQPVLDVPVILMHHLNTDVFMTFVNSPDRIAKINTCPHLQVLQRSFVSEVQKIYHGSIHVIPNGVPQVEEKDLADLTGEKPQKTIAMISRLESGKQQHLLIQAFERLAKDYPDWKIEIYGPPSKQQYFRQLETMILSLRLTEQVELMGTTNCPLDVLRTSDIFAFPSGSEGFALALTEAMTVGLPCVGLKTTSSVNELIVDGVNGLLADNTPEDFADKLRILMDDQNLRVKMGRAGHKMMKQYAPEIVWDQWEELIETVVRQHRQGKAV